MNLPEFAKSLFINKNKRRHLLFLYFFLIANYCVGYDSLKMALAFHQSSHFQKALPLLIDLSEKYKAKNDISNYALCQLTIADIIRNYGGVNIALELLDINQTLMEVRLEKGGLVLAENYIAKAEALFTATRFSEFKKAIQHSISIKRKLQLPDKYLTIDYLHLARYYKEMPNQNDSCYYWALKSLRLAQSDKSFSLYILPRIYNLLGYYFHPASFIYFRNKLDSLKRNFVLSRKYYDSAMMSLKKQPVIDPIMENKIYHNLGNSYSNDHVINNNLKLADIALHYYKKSEIVYGKYGSPADLALKNWVIGKTYERQALYDSALFQFQKGMSRLMPGLSPLSVNELPPLRPTLNDSRFITLASIKAYNFLYKYYQSHDIRFLVLAFHHFEFLLKFNHYLLSKSLHEQETIHFDFLYGLNVYNVLLRVAHELFIKTNDKRYFVNAYGLIASGKYAWMNKGDIEPTLNHSINASVLQEEIKLVKNTISNEIPGLSESRLNALFPAIPKTTFIKPLASINLVHQVLDTITVKMIQRGLSDKHEVLMDFYVSGNELYALIITENDINIQKQLLPKDFNATIRKLKRQMLTQKPNQYARLSHEIYSRTLDSLTRYIPKNTERLIICPDGNLQNIPWDALVYDTLNASSFISLHYLFNRFLIRTVLTPKQIIAKSTEKHSYLGIHSDFTHSKRFSQIPFSNTLVKDKGIELGGEVLPIVPNDSFHINILHIAAHVVNDSLHPYRSSIFFSDQDSLTLAELSKSRIRPRLAILNGCQTGNGTYLYTEGTISFARAFHRMKAESVLMTLWNVDDKSTADLLESFYHEIGRGNDLDYALREAKQHFIQNAPGDESANPYYWAGLQLSGKGNAILKPNRYWAFYLFIGCIALVLFAYYHKRSKNAGPSLKGI